MTYITPFTVTNANPGPTLYAALETVMLADGWTLEDTVVIGGNTHKILKSAAAGNAQGLDWYLDINFPTTGVTGGMRFAPFEGYTAASDVGLRGPYQSSSTTIDATTYSRYGATTHALETNWSNSASFSVISMALQTSTFTVWCSVTRDRIWIFTSIVTSTVHYAGFFVPTAAHAAHAGASLFPLIMAALRTDTASASGTNGGVAFTRMPKIVSAMNWSSSAYIPTQPATIGYHTSGQIGSAVSEMTGKMEVVPIPIMANLSAALSQFSAQPANIGAFDGIVGGYVASGAVRGDTTTDGTDTWVALTANTNWDLFCEAK